MNPKETHEQLDGATDLGPMPRVHDDDALDKQRIGRAQVQLLRLLARECAARVARSDG